MWSVTSSIYGGRALLGKDLQVSHADDDGTIYCIQSSPVKIQGTPETFRHMKKIFQKLNEESLFPGKSFVRNFGAPVSEI